MWQSSLRESYEGIDLERGLHFSEYLRLTLKGIVAIHCGRPAIELYILLG